MRSNKGITLTSLIIYLIIFSITAGTIAMITRNTRINLNNTTSEASSEQYLTLTQYLTDDLNSINLSMALPEANKLIILFKDNSFHEYLFENNNIYLITGDTYNINKQLTICNEIDNCSFTYISENKYLKVSVTIKDITYNNNYLIKNN